MATYTNLTSLAGLQVGDVVNYTVTTAFDTKGYKFKVELYGKKVSSNGGKTVFIIDTSILPEKNLSFNSRGDLIYGNTTDLYYRIAVAGDAGSDGKSGTTIRSGGVGGGNTGGNGRSSSSNYASGGGQTSGGWSWIAGTYGTGKFGAGGGGQSSISGSRGGAGGYGWYGGGGGTGSNGSGGGGGSGFIIGVSTSTYPAGYLGNDAELQRTIASSISEGLLTQGGSSSYTAKMVLTVVALPEGTSTQSIIKYYNGNSFVDTNIKYYNGTKFVDCDAFYYNGSEFVKI